MLKPGEVIDNKTLSELFGVANSGGMRRSLANFHLVIVADWTKRGVRNRWEGDVLHYTGQGPGDQRMDKQNKTLARSPTTGERVHLFEVHASGRYTYRGRAVLAGEPYQERQPDSNMRERTVWMFPLRPAPPDANEPVLGAQRPMPLYLPPGAHALVRGGFAPDRLGEVNALLDQIRALGVPVVDRRDIESERYDRARERWHGEVMTRLRRAARRRVEELRDRYEREGRTWAFASDEVEIDELAGEDRVREVLDTTGLGDQFEHLRTESYDAVEQPEPPDHDQQPSGPMSDEDFAAIRATTSRQMRRD